MCYLKGVKEAWCIINCPFKLKTKKRISFILIGTFFLFTGLEYGKKNTQNNIFLSFNY